MNNNYHAVFLPIKPLNLIHKKLLVVSVALHATDHCVLDFLENQFDVSRLELVLYPFFLFVLAYFIT